MITRSLSVHSSFVSRRALAAWIVSLALCLVAACGDEGDGPSAPQPPTEPVDSAALRPTITWDEPSARFRIYTDETLTLVPVLGNTDSLTTYVWTMDGKVVSRESHYSFMSHETGEFFVHLAVSNRYGTAEDEAKITVLQSQHVALPEMPEETRLWCFPWTGINIAQGRTIRVAPILLRSLPSDAACTWTLDGEPVSSPAAAEMCKALSDVAMEFRAVTQGTHRLTLTLLADGVTTTKDFTLHVCPPAGTHRRSYTGQAMVNKIYEFMPAPGHQVNGYIITGDSYPDGCTHEQACDTVLAHFQRRWSVSLGSQGGYLVAGFDHSVRVAADGRYDLCVRGNPFSYQSEPGIIWVSQDDNGDGLPNDQWFELAGSEFGTQHHATDYAITYYRPTEAHSATAWRDCTGLTGYVPYLSYWNPHDFYWQPWVEGTQRTYFGSSLQDRSTYENGISDIPPYDWGYADNLGSDFIDGPEGKMNYFRLANARTWDGQPARLEYIDFVKIQTAQIGSTPNLGDISTEVYYIGECKE